MTGYIFCGYQPVVNDYNLPVRLAAWKPINEGRNLKRLLATNQWEEESSSTVFYSRIAMSSKCSNHLPPYHHHVAAMFSLTFPAIFFQPLAPLRRGPATTLGAFGGTKNPPIPAIQMRRRAGVEPTNTNNNWWSCKFIVGICWYTIYNNWWPDLYEYE